jgi:hypothetical protein
VYGAVYDFIARRRQVNGLLVVKINRLIISSDYSGDCSRGVRVGKPTPADRNTSNLDPANNPDHDNDDDDNNNEELGADDMDELVGQLVDYVSDLALLS